MIEPTSVAGRVATIRRRIAERSDRPVTIVAVTKGFGVDAIEAAVGAGLADVGENYAQELLTKLAAIRGPKPVVHFVGRLQSNKVRLLAPVVDVWHTIDRPELGRVVAARAPGARVLVQVNVTGEPQKGGCEPPAVAGLVAALRGDGLAVEGLMTVGPAGEPELARPGFRQLRRLADELGLPQCSMGMTDDLDVAVEEGSTLVRLGTALFGLRPDRGARAH